MSPHRNRPMNRRWAAIGAVGAIVSSLLVFRVITDGPSLNASNTSKNTTAAGARSLAATPPNELGLVALGPTIPQEAFGARGTTAATAPTVPGRPSRSSVTWLPEPILIVDTTVPLAEPLAKRFRETGFEVKILDTASTSKIRTQIKQSSAVWFTNRAANALPVDFVSEIVSGDVPVVLDGDSPAARRSLDLRAETRTAAKFTFEDSEVILDTAAPVLRPKVPGYTTLAEIDSNTPALLRSKNVLWSFVRLDEGINLERMPYLLHMLESEFGVEPIAERRDIDLYLDPDLETNTSLRDLADRWSNAGIARVYIAGWKDDRRTNTHYDYSEFVRVMHESNIKVMAWLEWPHVNFSFWSQHPECIEKTATGADARIFWREHVALSVPGCFEKAWAETKLILDSAPFDGVNLAELYFEAAGEGPMNPTEYTPFNATVVSDFTRLHGFDPRLLIDKSSEHFWETDDAGFKVWNDYRGSLAIDYNRRLLRELAKTTAGKNLMVTAIDDRYAPNGEEFHGRLSLGQNIGANTYDLAELRNEVDFEFQVEDPFTMWVESPDRYSTVGRLYPDVPKERLVLDINVVDRPTAIETGFSMVKTGGFELAKSVASVAESGARLALYASASARLRDLQWIKFAMAGGASHVAQESNSVFQTNSPAAFRLRLSRPAWATTIDGTMSIMTTPVRYIDVPAGSHRVELHDTNG
jgi:hypothetical protein